MLLKRLMESEKEKRVRKHAENIQQKKDEGFTYFPQLRVFYNIEEIDSLLEEASTLISNVKTPFEIGLYLSFNYYKNTFELKLETFFEGGGYYEEIYLMDEEDLKDSKFIDKIQNELKKRFIRKHVNKMPVLSWC